MKGGHPGGSRQRIAVAVLGATGSVGQRFISLLEDHPWFQVEAVAASAASVGKSYAEAVRWMQSSPLPERVATMRIVAAAPPLDTPLVFSSLDAAVAGPIEEAFARAGHLVVSNAGSHRLDPQVPLLVAEINADHLDLLSGQRFHPGGIISNPNCSTIGLVLALKPLEDAFGIDAIQVVTMQAISGAGLPGVPSFEILDNLIPYIDGEEEKIEREARKILGRLEQGKVRGGELRISAQCNRVAVIDGHTECVSVKLKRPARPEEVTAAWEAFTALPQELNLPGAPARPIHYLPQPDAPQPRLHRDRERGMAVSIGRLRPCGVLDHRFVLLSHNTVRGAAGGAILTAELAVATGRLDEIQSRRGAA